jgi:hypothetical protein
MNAPDARATQDAATPRPTPAAAKPSPVAEREAVPDRAAARPASGGLIADDDGRDLAPGQMRKSDFLEQLRAGVCTAADSELTAMGKSTDGCPYIEKWIGHYRTQPAQRVETAIRKYAPQTAGAQSARDYIPLVSARVREGVRRWATTGDMTDVPEELQGELAGGGVMGGIGGALGAIGGAIGGAISSIFTKARPGGARNTGNPAEVATQLGSGSPLDSSLKSRMETAFSHDFSRVRVHTDHRAGQLSDHLNARAFTVGPQVAFGAGEYRPGTLAGDALIAHELAHVVQQDGGSAGPSAESHRLEEDADLAAMGAIAGPGRGGSNRAVPRLRSGLRLQRCSKRTTPATRGEADLWIQGKFGTRVAAAVKEGRTASASVFHFEDDVKFCPAAAAAGIEHSCDTILGFVDPNATAPNHVWIHKGKAGPDTVLHEAMHVYSHQDFLTKMKVPTNEGATEYFSRQIASAQNFAISETYPDEYKQIAALVQEFNEDLLLNAYFQGRIAEMKAAVDGKLSPPTFEAWRCEMAEQEFARAEDLIRGKDRNPIVSVACQEVLPPI